MKLLIFSVTCFCIVFVSSAKSVPDDDSFSPAGGGVRAVNLGGWLVTEGWIKPSLFDGIRNKDFLDGTGLQFKSVTLGKYLSAENGGGSIIVANRTNASGWETFTLWRINETTFNLRVFNKQFVGLSNLSNNNNNHHVIAAEAHTPSLAQTFQIYRNPTNLSLVRIKAPNGFFLQVKSEGTVTADYKGKGEWEDAHNPSVFLLTISNTLQGEYQITNGYGPSLAPKVMKEHWETFIVEDDFKFIKNNRLNGVRIPVGWWIVHDPPPTPYVNGSLQALDNAFSWASKYGIKVIVDLHAAPGSQNGWEHSASRDGSQEWGTSNDNINQTVHVIDFLAARYAKNPSLFAVELINEPLAPGVSLRNLSKYYKDGYDAVRKHSQTAYVVLSNRLGTNEPREFFNLTNVMTRSVIDVHFYNLFSDSFNNLTVQQNIDYIYKNRKADLKKLTTSNGTGPLILVGEWVAEWSLKNATKTDIKRYGEAQLQVYGNGTTFGWSYWCLKNVNNHWSLEWMIKNGYIKL